MAITFNGTTITAVTFNGTAVNTVTYNGTTVFTSEQTANLNSVGAYYAGQAQTTNYTSTSAAIGASTSSNYIGGIIAFPVTADMLTRATSAATFKFNITASTYGSTLRYILPTNKLIPKLSTTSTSTSYSTFNTAANYLAGSTAVTGVTSSISGTVLTITVTADVLKTWANSLVTVDGSTYLTFGFRNLYNSQYMYRLTNTATWTYQ